MAADSERTDEPESKVALSDSEERFRLLVDSMQDYSVFPLSVDGRVANWNLGAERLKGFKTEEAIGLHFARFFPEQEQVERVPDRLLTRAESEGRAEYEGWLLRKDNSRFWGTVVLSPMRDQEGRLRGFSNVARNLTERKKVEQTQTFLADVGEVLTGSLDYEKTLLEVARLAVRSIADWCTVSVRGASGLAVVSGAHAEPSREPDVRALFRALPADAMRQPRGVGLVMRTGQPELCHDTHEAAWVRTALEVDSPERFLALGARSYMCVPLKARGDTFGAITFVSVRPGRRYGQADLALAEELVRRAALAVDNARLFRKAQEALKARDEFLSMASHDLRSPLSALRLQLHALRKELQPGTQCPVAPKTGQRVESMERQIDRMLHMMDALMDISQMTAGRLELKRQNLDLVGVAREVVSTLEEELRQAGVEVRLHAQGPVKGAWDRTRLEQVVDNLLSNAIKYGEGRPVDLILSADENSAELIVKDQGVGISPEDQERLFERFERVRLNREVTGYGVGLWIVRRVVEAHGGSTSVRSRLGEGASFIVRLPLRAPEPTAPGRSGGRDPEAHPPSMH